MQEENINKKMSEFEKQQEIINQVRGEYLERMSDEKLSEWFVRFAFDEVNKESIERFQKERDRVAACFIQEARRHPTLCKVAARHLVNIALRAAVRVLMEGKKERPS